MDAHSEGREAGAIKISLAQGEALIRRVIIIGQLSADRHDLDIANAGGPHHEGCGLPSGYPTAGANFGVFTIGSFSLNEVFKRMGVPVFCLNFSIKS